MKIKKISSLVGFSFFLIGLGGLGGACEGQGSFLISAVVFSLGIGLSWWGIEK